MPGPHGPTAGGRAPPRARDLLAEHGQDLAERERPDAAPLDVEVRERYNPIIRAMRGLPKPIIDFIRQHHGTTLVDVGDPRSPRQLATLEVPAGTHSHKVRALDGLMLVNREGHGAQPGMGAGGLGIWDVSTPSRPREISFWRSGGLGVHRFTFDGRYAYISPTAEGYVGNIMMILDLADPTRPEEVCRWWIPGQWEAGGEEYPWAEWTKPRCHHPMRAGDRLYVSYWHHGFHILDIADMARPQVIASVNTSPVYPHPTHTCLPMPEPLKGRRIMVVADEDVAKLWPAPPA